MTGCARSKLCRMKNDSNVYAAGSPNRAEIRTDFMNKGEDKMKKTGRPLWKKIMAFVCVLTVCVTATQWPIGTAEAASVTTIYLKNADGYTWYDADLISITESFADESVGNPYSDTSNKFTYASDNQGIKVTKVNGGTFGARDIAFYLQCNTIPQIEASDGLSVTPMLQSGALYRLTINGLTTTNKDTITLTPVVPKFNVTLPTTRNYTISDVKVNEQDQEYSGPGAKSIPVSSGESFSFTVTPSTGYAIDSVTYTGVNSGTVILDGTSADVPLAETAKKYTIAKVSENYSITINVEKEEYTITYNKSNEEGYTLVEGSGTASYGDPYVFNVNPKDGYDAPEIQYQFDEQDAVTLATSITGTYTIPQIKGNTTITVTGPKSKKNSTVHFEPNPDAYEIELLDDLQGQLLNNDVTVEYGKSVKFKVNLKKDYDKSPISVKVVGGKTLEKGGDGAYTITSVTSDTIVEIDEVALNSYQVTLKNGKGYTLGASSTDGVPAGRKITITLSALPGYTKGNAKLYATPTDGDKTEISLDSNLQQYIYEVHSDVTIEADDFTEITYTPEIKVILGNTQSEETNQLVTVTDARDEELSAIKEGEDLLFKVSVKNGNYYKITSVTSNGSPVEMANDIYTVYDVTATPRITVTLEEIPVNVTYKDERYGNNSTATWTISTMGETDQGKKYAKVVEPKFESKMYVFDGWYNDRGDKIDKITEEYLGQTMILTAKWKLGDKIGPTLTTEGNTQDSIDSHSVNYVTRMEFEQGYATDPEYSNYVHITCFGTLYSNKTFVPENFKEKIGQRRKSGEEYQNGSTQILNYFDDGTVDVPVGELGIKLNFALTMFLDQALKSDRWGAGWVELTIMDNGSGEEEKLIVVADKATQVSAAPAAASEISLDAESMNEDITAISTSPEAVIPIDPQADTEVSTVPETTSQETPVVEEDSEGSEAKEDAVVSEAEAIAEKNITDGN